MLNKLNFIIFIVILSCGFSVSADSTILDREQEYELEKDGFIRVDEKFRVAVSTAIKGWVANPINNHKRSSQISWLDLNKFLSEVDQVNVYINPTNRAVIGSGNRTGGVYFNEEKKVIINLSLFEALTRKSESTSTTLVGSGMLLMHEYLGALGYPDENYEISSHLYMRSTPWDYGSPLIQATENQLKIHLDQNLKRTENIQFERVSDSGTSTGVGGGGDPASASVKMMLFAVLGRYDYHYKSILKTEENYLKLVNHLLKLKIEPAVENETYDKDKQIFAVDIKMTKDGPKLVVPTSVIFYLNSPQRYIEFGDKIINYIMTTM